MRGGDIDPKNKVAMLTGGARIGQVVAHALALRGCNLALIYRGSGDAAEAYGGPEVLKFTDYPDPTPGPGEVLIRVAAAINPIDLLQRSGATKDFFPVEFPGIIGRDVSGTVLELGAGVDKSSVGDKVFALAFHNYEELCSRRIYDNRSRSSNHESRAGDRGWNWS